MAKILIQRERREKIDDKMRVITSMRTFFVQNDKQDYHSEIGVVRKEDLKLKDGKTVETSSGKSLVILSPSFIDSFKRLKKFAQTPPLKDMAVIAAETGIGPDTIVLDAGAGSGHMCCFFAYLCKKVITCDIRAECLEMTKHNIEELGLKNVELVENDIYLKSPVKNADVMTLDVPEPWNAVDTALKALVIGGFLVSYSPSVMQVSRFVNAIRDKNEFLYLKTIEVIERPWKVDGEAVRPANSPIGHSAFLTFVRRIS